MHKNYCSSWEYAQKTLFIPILFLGITMHSNTIIANTDIVHIMLTNHIGTVHYSYWHRFLPTF